jgi:hypothetical protein
MDDHTWRCSKACCKGVGAACGRNQLAGRVAYLVTQVGVGGRVVCDA